MLRKLLSLRTLRAPGFAVRLLVCAAYTLPVFVGTAGAQAGPARTALNTFTSAGLSAAVDLGPLPSSQPMTLTLTLAPSAARSAALDQFLLDVTTPSSPSYHQWLTPVEYAASYGATAEQISAATAWAQTQGLAVVATSPADARITVSGFAGQVENAFAVPLHAYRVNGVAAWAPAAQPTLPAAVAELFSGVDGFDTLPAETALTMGGAATSFAALAQTVDANGTPLLALNSGLCTASVSPAQVAEYAALFRQATSQGMTILSTRSCAAGGFPAALAEVTGVALAGDGAETAAPLAVRPVWQTAAGLPEDGMRHAPDVEASSLSAMAAALTTIASSAPGNRLGNINRVLYELAPAPGLYTQPDAAAAGTWEAEGGLGMVDLQKLVKTWPRGTGSSFTSFSASTYSPVHGQPSIFTSNVTSGTGGATPTGSVTFATSTGTTIGTASLVNGTATFTETALDGGSYTVQANYQGDGTYAASSSGTGSFFVQPEPSQLTATVSTGNALGGNFTVAVTDTAGSGVGTPSGAVTVTVYGATTQTASGTLAASGANTASATVSVPAMQVGTLSLEINCTTSLNYSCYNAVNKTVVIGKATPTLKFSYSPTTLVAGQTISLTATVTGAGTAPTPTGNVEFFDGTTVLNAGGLQNGSVTVTGTVPNTSTHTITALYQGDNNYVQVNSATQTTTPTTGTTATSTALVVSGTTIPQGNALLLTANITPSAVVGGVSPTGSVTFSAASQGVLGTAAVTGGGAQLQITPAQGSYAIAATYSGDGNYAGSTSPATTVTVTAANSSTAVLSATISSLTGVASTYDPITATVAVTGGATPSGPVTASYTYQGAQVVASANFTSTGTGSASASIPLVLPAAAGTYMVTVACANTDSFVCSNTVSFSVTVTSATATGTVPTTTTLALTPAAPAVGASVVLTATVASTTTNTTALAGTVTFFSGTTVLGTGTISSGVATYTTTVSSASQVFTAMYGGNATYAASTSAAVGVTSTLTPTTTTLTTSSTQSQAGAGVTLTATVQGSSTTATTTATSASSSTSPTGIVTFYAAGTVPLALGTVNVGSAGPGLAIASLTTTQIPAGNQTLYAVYSGDPTYATSTSVSIAIGLSDYAIAFTPPTLTLTPGASGTVRMAVTTSGSFTGSILIGCTQPANINLTCSVENGNLTGSGVSVLTIKTFTSTVARNERSLSTSALRAMGGFSLAALLGVLLPGRRRGRLPALLLVLLSLGLTTSLGCSSVSTTSGILQGGTPLGTYIVTVNSSGTNGVTTVTHDYSYQVTVQ